MQNVKEYRWNTGRKILPHEELVKIGFSVETIGKQIVQQVIDDT